MGGVISYCMVDQPTTVRVMRSDGEVLEFDYQVIAKQLMKVYPGHLVVHCTQASRSGIAPRSKVTMLRADDTLQLGQTYCLLRVPVQRGKASKGSGANASNGDAQQVQNITHYRLPPLAALQQQQFGAPWRPHLDAIVESPLNMNTPSRRHSLTRSPLALQAGYVPGSAIGNYSPARVAPSPIRADLKNAARPRHLTAGPLTVGS